MFFTFLLFIKTSQAFQVFTFLLKTNQEDWERMDWTKITTICLAGWIDNNIVKFAHSKGAKVLKLKTSLAYFKTF